MAKTQWERQQKYLQNKTTYHVRVLDDEVDNVLSFIKSKGYKSVNDYFSTIIKLDMLIDLTPTRDKAMQVLDKMK